MKDERKMKTAAWFGSLQAQLIKAFEQLEDDCEGPYFPGAEAAGRFSIKPWERVDHSGAPGGGGSMAMMRGRVFEKVGVHVSTVFGSFAPEFASQIPGAQDDPRFWAAGVSLIAHPWNPNAPTAHMNTRHVVTAKQWFGGGADLTPVLDNRRVQSDADAVAFHAAMRGACSRHASVAPYERYRAWCDEYFHLKHRNEPRGVGGIFFDNLEFQHDEELFEPIFEFVRDLGESFLNIYPAIMRANIAKPWSEAEREEQLIRRGRYVEFNLLYDRGTIFGLRTGGNVDSILSSMPPLVKWP